jgi:hypothetical protein
MFDASAKTATTAAREAIAHKALGNDYIVSPTLVRARRHREAAWPNELGACSVDEAFALAGLKSRMYRSVPMSAEPHGLVSLTTGLFRDLATTKLNPPLWRAIVAALGPNAISDEAACAERLLAVRSRLNDLLVARDEILRLARRDALGSAWERPFDQGPVSGPAGNDLSAHLAYHLMAALNALTAVADNLTWIVRRRCGIALGDDDTSSGFFRLLTDRRRERMTDELKKAVDSLISLPRTPLALGLLRLRNTFAHREGLDYGLLTVETMSIPMARSTAALWYFPASFGQRVRIDTRDIDLFDACLQEATLGIDGHIGVVTFPKLVNIILAVSFELTHEMLGSPPWRSPQRWLYRSRAHADQRLMRRLWRADLQPKLFGLPAT